MYSLRKSRKALRHLVRLFHLKKRKLSDEERKSVEKDLLALQTSLKEKNKKETDVLLRKLELRTPFQRSFLERMFHSFLGLGLALLVAIVIRQLWFEFYIVPTGSMRPTINELDALAVTKTKLGINKPLCLGHFLFYPDLLTPGKIVVFSAKNLDLPDVKTKYFFIFPGIKQLVKRLIGKPENTLYFYGGLIYGIDREGNDLKLQDNPFLQAIEHIPFIRLEGKIKISNGGIASPIISYQMNIPIAKLDLEEGRMLLPYPNYYDAWGFKNYAMSRIIKTANGTFLELTHHPKITPKDDYQQFRPHLSITNSFIPLTPSNLLDIAKHLTTSRFIVKDKKAYRYGSTFANPYLPTLDVPNGIYEFFNGIGYRILPLGISYKLCTKHPLYLAVEKDPALFYNLGIEWDTRVAAPSRYAYFRNKDLYLMGQPIFLKNDPTLLLFLFEEAQKEDPFIDYGAPIKDGKLDSDFIRRYGLKIPEKKYLFLGDNHAMSADSREFGFVPEDNIKGSVSFRMWPPGPRLGLLFQPLKPLITLPTILIWILASFTIFGSIYISRKIHNIKK